MGSPKCSIVGVRWGPSSLILPCDSCRIPALPCLADMGPVSQPSARRRWVAWSSATRNTCRAFFLFVVFVIFFQFVYPSTVPVMRMRGRLLKLSGVVVVPSRVSGWYKQCSMDWWLWDSIGSSPFVSTKDPAGSCGSPPSLPQPTAGSRPRIAPTRTGGARFRRPSSRRRRRSRCSPRSARNPTWRHGTSGATTLDSGKHLRSSDAARARPSSPSSSALTRRGLPAWSECFHPASRAHPAHKTPSTNG